MPLPILPGVVRASIGGPIAGGSRWSNTTHWRRIDLGAPTDALIGLLHVELATFYGGAIMVWCPPPTAVESAGYTTLDGTSGALALPAPIPGTGGGGNMPAEVATVMTVRTAARGRQNRGRIYLPAFGISSLSSVGHIADSVVAGILAAMAVLRTAAGVAGWELGVASYGKSLGPHGVVLRTWDPHFTPCTTVTMDGVADVMRSRKAQLTREALQSLPIPKRLVARVAEPAALVPHYPGRADTSWVQSRATGVEPAPATVTAGTEPNTNGLGSFTHDPVLLVDTPLVEHIVNQLGALDGILLALLAVSVTLRRLVLVWRATRRDVLSELVVQRSAGIHMGAQQ